MSDNSHSGVTFLELLTLLFIGLKLSGIINWSWWVVASPMLIQITLLLVASAWAFWYIRRLNKQMNTAKSNKMKIYQFPK